MLRDQRVIAGIGRAYANEILHAAMLGPFTPVGKLTPDELDRLLTAIKTVLLDATERFRRFGPVMPLTKAPTGIYDVHRRAGEPCPRCSSPLAHVDYESYQIVYCPDCQTGGKLYADRRMSRLLK